MESTQYLQNTLYGFESRSPDGRRTYDRSERKTYDIKQLWQRQHEIINLALTGMKNVDIAKILGITKESVSQTLNSELGMKKLASLREKRDDEAVKVADEIKKLTVKALEIYNDIFDAPTDIVSYKLKKETADTVALDLAGHRAATKIDTRSMHFTASLDEIEEFKRRGIEAARAAGMIVDINQVAGMDTALGNRNSAPLLAND